MNFMPTIWVEISNYEESYNIGYCGRFKDQIKREKVYHKTIIFFALSYSHP